MFVYVHISRPHANRITERFPWIVYYVPNTPVVVNLTVGGLKSFPYRGSDGDKKYLIQLTTNDAEKP